MKRMLAIGASLAAATLAVAGTVHAQNDMQPGMGGMGANSDRTVTRAEALAGAQQMFDSLDANKDGKIDAADREARVAAMFDRMDTNKDGQISRAEFMAAHAGRPGDSPDGRGMGGMRSPGGRGDMMMRMADANKDGTITRDEFISAVMARFDSGDTNHDGKVTPEERKAARDSMRAHWRDRGGADTAPPADEPSGE